MNSQQQQHPNEVFCGNLSFFCEEQDLLHLFQDYSRVRSIRIIRNPEKTKSLMFGFARMETVAEAEEIARIFNGQMFMGRRIKVTHPSVPDIPHPDSTNSDGEGPPLHLAIACSPDNPVVPTELFLRKIMVLFGPVHDVTVREFLFNEANQRFEGYAFVAFCNSQTSFGIISSKGGGFMVDGIAMRPSLSFRGTSGSGGGSGMGGFGGNMGGGFMGNTNNSPHPWMAMRGGGRGGRVPYGHRHQNRFPPQQQFHQQSQFNPRNRHFNSNMNSNMNMNGGYGMGGGQGGFGGDYGGDYGDSNGYNQGNPSGFNEQRDQFGMNPQDSFFGNVTETVSDVGPKVKADGKNEEFDLTAIANLSVSGIVADLIGDDDSGVVATHNGGEVIDG